MTAGSIQYSVFISSVPKELQAERRAGKDYILGDPLLRRFIIDVFLFEDIPAQDRKPNDVYLTEVQQRDIYLGIFGKKYGRKNSAGLSPTELEFDHATLHHRHRLIFVKGDEDSARDKEMVQLFRKADMQLTRRRFADIPALLGEVYASLVGFLEGRGALSTKPFDASVCVDASMDEIDEEKVKLFVRTAELEGRLTFKGTRTSQEILQHLNLVSDNRPTNAAVLLFGRNPGKFFSNPEIHCLHFLGTEKRKPIESHQPFRGTLFETIDQAVEFVLSKLSRRVGTRAASARAPVKHEIPRDAIAEAIVNAVAQCDYQRSGFVQVIVFADRVEIWNPGELPPPLTPDMLKKPHGPMPRNPLIAEPLFRAHYTEKAGTGTTDMVADCKNADLPEPDFAQNGPHFVVTLWRDWLTDEVLVRLVINERQRTALAQMKVSKRITNAEYQHLTKAIKKTASRDLADLVRKGLLKKIGPTGRGTFYVFAEKGDIKGTKGTQPSKGSETAQRTPTKKATPNAKETQRGQSRHVARQKANRPGRTAKVASRVRTEPRQNRRKNK